MPTEFIPRYDKFDNAMFNDALATLETMAFNAGNVLEVVTSGTLTATSTGIDLPLNGIIYRWLRLRVSLESTPTGASIQLASNGARISTAAASLTYRLMAIVDGGISTSSFGTDAIIGYTSDTAGDRNFIEQIIWPNAVGFTTVGQFCRYNGGIVYQLLTSGVNTNGVPTSFLLYPNGTNVFNVGGTYILEGVRA